MMLGNELYSHVTRGACIYSSRMQLTELCNFPDNIIVVCRGIGMNNHRLDLVGLHLRFIDIGNMDILQDLSLTLCCLWQKNLEFSIIMLLHRGL